MREAALDNITDGLFWLFQPLQRDPQLPVVSSSDSIAIPDSLIDEMEEIALELRAPYISMVDDDDILFSSCPIPLLDDDGINNE